MTSNPFWKGECPKCGTALIGLTQQEYADHLREDDNEELAARIIEDLVVSEEEIDS